MLLEEAYGSLFEYIRTDIIPNKKIVQVTSLTAKLKSFVPSGEISESTRKNIRRRLEKTRIASDQFEVKRLGTSYTILQVHRL